MRCLMLALFIMFMNTPGFLRKRLLPVESVPTLPTWMNFPTREFLNVSTMGGAGYATVVDEMLCQNKDKRSRCCKCDGCFMKYGYCCKDILWQESKPQSMESYTRLLVSQSKQYKHPECREALPFVSSMGHRSKEYMIIATCLPGVSKHATDLCSRENASPSMLDVPVIASDSYLYKNQYCARCNHVHNFTWANIAGMCQHIVNNHTMLSNMKECSFSIYHKNSKYNKLMLAAGCYSRSAVWNKHCETTSIHHDLCKSYTAPTFGYANYHCWKCNKYHDKHSMSRYNHCFYINDDPQFFPGG